MAGTTFRTWVKSFLPSWMLNPWGARYFDAFAGFLDFEVAKAKQAVKLRFAPSNVGIPDPADVLPVLGAERGIIRSPTESDYTYLQRIKDAWVTWPYAGTPYGILKAYDDVGYSRGFIHLFIRNGKKYTLDNGGNLVISNLASGWVTDFTVGYPAWTPNTVLAAGKIVVPSIPNGKRYRVLIGGTTSGAEPAWPTTDGLIFLDGGVTFQVAGSDQFWSHFDIVFDNTGSELFADGIPAETSAEAQTLKEILLAWKPAHAATFRLILLDTYALFGYPITNKFGDGAYAFGSAGVTYWSPVFV